MNNITRHDHLVGKTVAGYGECDGCYDLVLSFTDYSFVVLGTDIRTHLDYQGVVKVPLIDFEFRRHGEVCLGLGVVTQTEVNEHNLLTDQRRQQRDYLSMQKDIRELERLEKKYR